MYLHGTTCHCWSQQDLWTVHGANQEIRCSPDEASLIVCKRAFQTVQYADCRPALFLVPFLRLGKSHAESF